MHTIFMISESSKASKHLYLIIGEKTIALSNLSIYYKYLYRHGMINLNCQMDRIPYQVFKDILNTF